MDWKAKLNYLFLKLCYSHKTQHLLNYVTLKISDEQISHEFKLARAQHFDRIFKPAIIISILYLLQNLIDKFVTPEKTLINLVSSLYVLSMIVIWGIIRWRWQLHARKLIFVFVLVQCIKTNLAIRDQLPSWMS